MSDSDIAVERNWYIAGMSLVAVSYLVLGVLFSRFVIRFMPERKVVAAASSATIAARSVVGDAARNHVAVASAPTPQSDEFGAR